MTRVLYAANRLARALNRAGEDSAGALGVTLPQYLVMQVLGEGVPMANARLARRTFVSPQASNTVVHELLTLGVVTRRDDPGDGRTMLISLTDKGWELLVACDEAVLALEHRLAAELGEPQGALLRYLSDASEILAGGYFGDVGAEKQARQRRDSAPRASGPRAD